jgi:hypothetical protein
MLLLEGDLQVGLAVGATVTDACKSTGSSEYSRGIMTSGLISIPTKSLGECLSQAFLSHPRCH